MMAPTTPMMAPTMPMTAPTMLMTIPETTMVCCCVIFSGRDNIDECYQVGMTRTMVVTTTSSVGPPGSLSSSRFLRPNLSRTAGCLLQDISYMSTLYLLLYHHDVVCIECIMYPVHSFEFQPHCIQCMTANGLPVVQV
jgi:hypothetical protein